MNKKELREFFLEEKREIEKKEELIYLSLRGQKILGFKLSKTCDRYYAYAYDPETKKRFRFFVKDMTCLEQEIAEYKQKNNVSLSVKEADPPVLAGKEEQIKEMLSAGKKRVQISKELGCSQNYLSIFIKRKNLA